LELNNLNLENQKNSISDFLKSFTEELSKFLKDNKNNLNEETKEKSFQKYPSDADNLNEIDNTNELKNLKFGDICVVNQVLDERVSFIDTENGKYFDVFFAKDSDTYNDLVKSGISKDKIQIIEEDEFYDIQFGDKFIINSNNELERYSGDLDIDNLKLRSDSTTDAWYDLDSIENTLKNQEGKEYVVKEITDDKIIMTNLEGEGHIETYLKLNPEVKVGDILVRTGREYCIKGK